eukprot:352775-Chlamydomonas_euryale.AAC.16
MAGMQQPVHGAVSHKLCALSGGPEVAAAVGPRAGAAAAPAGLCINLSSLSSSGWHRRLRLLPRCTPPCTTARSMCGYLCLDKGCLTASLWPSDVAVTSDDPAL